MKKQKHQVSQHDFAFNQAEDRIIKRAHKLADERVSFDTEAYVNHVRSQFKAIDKAAKDCYENSQFSFGQWCEKGVNSNLWTYLNNPNTAGIGGTNVTDWHLMASFTNNNVVYTCADRNAMAVAKGCKNFRLLTTQPKSSDVTQRSVSRPKYKTKKLVGKSLKSVKKSVSDDVEIVELTDHPLIDLLTYTADEDLNGFQIWYATQLNLEVFGRAYWYLFRNGVSDQGEPVGIRILKTYYLTPIRDLEGIVTAYAYLNVIDGCRHETIYFDTDEVIDFRYVSLSDLYAGGTSWLRACWGRIGLSSKWTEYQNWLLDNKAAPGVILQQDKDGSMTGSGSSAEEKRLEKDFTDRVKGRNNGRPIVLPPGTKAIPFGLSPTELAPLEIVKQLTNEVATAAGQPPELVGGVGTYDNMEQARQFWREGGIAPRMLTMEQVVNDTLIPFFGDDTIWVEFENPVPEDEVFELQVQNANVLKAAEGRAAGDITKDEHRALLGLPPMTDGTGDELLLPPAQPQDTEDLSSEADDQQPQSSEESTDDEDQKGFNLEAILKINAQVVKGKLPRAAAVTLAALACDIDEEQAKRLIGFPVRKAKKTKAKLPPVQVPSGEAIAHVMKGFYQKMKGHFEGQIGSSKSLSDRISQQFTEGGERVTKADGLPDKFVPLDAWTDDLDHRLQPLIEMEMKQAADGRTKALTQIGASPDTFAVVPQHVQKAVKKASLNLASSTISTTAMKLNDALKALRQELADGLLEGDPIDELTDRVKSIFGGLDDDHAELIARTEASRAVHTGQRIAAKASGIVKGFKFLTSSECCDECADLDGTEVDLDGTFTNDGYDPSSLLPVHPKCRCTCQEVIDFDALDDDTGDDGNDDE